MKLGQFSLTRLVAVAKGNPFLCLLGQKGEKMDYLMENPHESNFAQMDETPRSTSPKWSIIRHKTKAHTITTFCWLRLTNGALKSQW